MKTSFKKLTSLFLAILMAISVISITGVSAANIQENPTSDTQTLYVDVSGVNGDGKYFAWVWSATDNGSARELTGTGTMLEVQMSVGEGLVLARMPVGSTTLDWNSKISQTGNIDYNGTFNCVQLSGDGSSHTVCNYNGSDITPTAPTASRDTLPPVTVPSKATEASEEIPTYAPASDEDQYLYVVAQSNLDLAGLKSKTTGDLISVTYSLTAANIIDGGQATVTFDPTVLGFSTQNTVDSMFPVAKGVTYNVDAAKGKVKFNFSTINNDFKQEGAFITLVFERKYDAVGSTNVFMRVSDLTSKAVTYVEDGVILSTTGIVLTSKIATATATTPTAPAPVATDATTDIDVSVSSNLTKKDTYEIDVNKSTVRVTFDITAGEPVAFGDVVVSYDEAMLALEPRFNTLETMFPVVSNVSYNLNSAQGQMAFTFTGIDAANNKGLYDFSNGGTLVTLVFTVKSGAQGRADIRFDVKDLGTMTKDYVADYDAAEDIKGAITGAVENATVSPTAPTTAPLATGPSTSPTIEAESTSPTEAPTTEPTEAPTTEPTEKPTQKPTEKPTQAPTAKPTVKPTQPATKAPVLTLKATKLAAGKTTTASVANKGSNKVTFTSSKSTVAKIDKNTGKITALQKGTTYITAKVGTKTLKVKLTVTSNPVLKKGSKTVKNNATYTIKKNQKLTLKASGKASAIKTKVTNNKKKIAKATVSGTKVTVKGLKKGTATLKIKLNGVKTYTVKVKVK